MLTLRSNLKNLNIFAHVFSQTGYNIFFFKILNHVGTLILLELVNILTKEHVNGINSNLANKQTTHSASSQSSPLISTKIFSHQHLHGLKKNSLLG